MKMAGFARCWRDWVVWRTSCREVRRVAAPTIKDNGAFAWGRMPVGRRRKNPSPPSWRLRAVRKASPREILAFLQNLQQIGRPATMNTDACLGFCAMGYQSWGIAYGICEAGPSCLVRHSGPVTEDHCAPESSPTRRGKVGLRSCCVAATQVAIPVSYNSGPFGELKHVGLRLWAPEGPWEGRRLAAMGYVLNSNCIPLSPWRDWAARSSEFHSGTLSWRPPAFAHRGSSDCPDPCGACAGW